MRLCDDRLYGNRTLSRPFVSLFPALPLYRFTRPLCHQSTELNPPSSFVDHDMRLFLCPNYTPVVERANRPTIDLLAPQSILSNHAAPSQPSRLTTAAAGGRIERARNLGHAALQLKPSPYVRRERKKGSMLDRALDQGLPT